MASLFLKGLHVAGLLPFYNWIRRPRFTGAHARQWWETRDNGATSSAEVFWEGRTHPARDAVASVVATLPGDSILEIGVHAGPLLWAIAQRKTFRRLAGTELSAKVLEFTRANLPQALGQTVELVQAAADRLPFEDKSFDIVVTGVTLVCIGPDLILPSLNEVLRVCSGFLVLAEPYSDDPKEGTARGRKDYYPNTSYWIRNYAELLKGRAEVVGMHRFAPDHSIGHLDSVVVLKVL